jgi:hypothetical protein
MRSAISSSSTQVSQYAACSASTNSRSKAAISSGVVELDDVDRLLRALGVQRGHDQRVRIPLDHHVG